MEKLARRTLPVPFNTKEFILWKVYILLATFHFNCTYAQDEVNFGFVNGLINWL